MTLSISHGRVKSALTELLNNLSASLSNLSVLVAGIVAAVLLTMSVATAELVPQAMQQIEPGGAATAEPQTVPQAEPQASSRLVPQASQETAPQAATSPSANLEVVLTFTGDVLLNTFVSYYLAKFGADYPFHFLHPWLERSALTACNLEAPITQRGKAFQDKQFTFRTPPSIIATLLAAPIHLCTLANNHMADYGAEGVLDTIAALDKAGIAHAGAGATIRAARAPARLEIKPATVGIGPAAVAALRTGAAAAPQADQVAATQTDTAAALQTEIAAAPQTDTIDVPQKVPVTGTQTGTEAALKAGTVPAAQTGTAEPPTGTIAGPQTGSAETPRTVTVAVLAYSKTLPFDFFAGFNRPGTADGNDDYLAPDIAAARQHADLVAVCVHWGTELMTTPKPYQVDYAHLAIDSGADLVIGHHPHVLQPLEVYHGKLIAYSLGNFIFGAYSHASFDGMLLQLIVRDKKIAAAEVVPLDVNNLHLNFQPRPKQGAAASRLLEGLAKASKHFNAELLIKDDLGVVTIK